MAKKSSNTLLLVGAVGVGAYFLWKNMQPVAAAAPASIPTTLAAPVQSVDNTSSPVADPRIVEISKWVATLTGQQQQAVNAALAVMPSGEIDSLYDIVLNDFYGNGITSPLQAQFWNMWRAKYNIPT